MAGPLEVERGVDGVPIEFRPAPRLAASATSVLHAYGDGPFCRIVPPALPAGSGVYIVCNGTAVLYVGEARDLRKRWGLGGYGSIQPRNCYVGGQSTNCRVNGLVLEALRSGGSLSLWVRACDDFKELERGLISTLRPPWNRKGLGSTTVRSSK
jgi:hypothetical protein